MFLKFSEIALVRTKSYIFDDLNDAVGRPSFVLTLTGQVGS